MPKEEEEEDQEVEVAVEAMTYLPSDTCLEGPLILQLGEEEESSAPPQGRARLGVVAVAVAAEQTKMQV